MRGDNAKAKEVLGWEYEMTNEELIEQLVKDYLHYYQWQRNKN